jgi:hypothetical protein
MGANLAVIPAPASASTGFGRNPVSTLLPDPGLHRGDSIDTVLPSPVPVIDIRRLAPNDPRKLQP